LAWLQILFFSKLVTNCGTAAVTLQKFYLAFSLPRNASSGEVAQRSAGAIHIATRP
jgi:hypothetical protein